MSNVAISPPPRNHVVITGTGRAGTTFLVELLTHLGLETGFSLNDLPQEKHGIARAGLEKDIRHENSPYIVKSPLFCYYAHEVISREDIIIDHIFVPIRDLNAAAESRRYVERSSVAELNFFERLKYMIFPRAFKGELYLTRAFKGGLIFTHSLKAGRQEEVLSSQLYKLALSVSDKNIPVTFMRYPRIIKDCRYLYEKMQPVLQGITYDVFHDAFHKTVCSDIAHSFNKDDVFQDLS